MESLAILAQAAAAAKPGVPWHLWDTLILGTFFLGMIIIVLWVLLQKEETSSDYFLAGRSAGWLSIGSSIFASNIGSEHLVGLAGAGFVSGMAMAHWEMHGWLILVLGWVFVPFYDRIKVFTMPEFLERRFNPSSRSILSIISLVSYVLTKVAVTVYSGGVVFSTVFGIDRVPDSVPLLGGMDMFWVSAIGLVVITGIYTVLGGMKAVMYTSVLQTPVLLIGSVVILVAGLSKVGGWGEVERICGANCNLVRPPSDPNFPWTGVLFMSPIIGFWYWCTDQYIVQRVLSGRNQKEARRGAILAGYFKLLPVFIFLVPGMIAYALNTKGLLAIPTTATGQPDADKAFSTLVAQLLPVGFKGVVVCGLLAALMSSLASLFNSSAALFIGDFYKKLVPSASEKHLVVAGKIVTAVVVVLGIVWIPVMKGMGNVLYQYLQGVQNLLAPAIASAFLLGVFWKRASGGGALTGLVAGFGIGMFRLTLDVMIGGKIKAISGALGLTADQKAAKLAELAQQYGVFYRIEAVNWLHFGAMLFVLCVAIMVIVSLLSKPPAKEQLRFTYGAATPEERAATRASWNAWDVVHSAIVLGIIVAFYVYFWQRF
jgi:SSS family solute:Na+ symporter